MKIYSLLEIIEPTLKNKKWHGNFDSKKIFGGNKERNVGTGNFSTVDSIPNDPHMVKKTSNIAKKNPDHDAYWSFITEIVENKLWENPYFPRVYDITKIQDKEGKIMYRGKIEKLVELDDAINDLDDLNSLSRKIVGHELNENYNDLKTGILNVYFAEFIEKYVKLEEATGIFRNYPEKDFDSSFKEACKKIREMAKTYGWKIDIHQWNIMVRRGPHGLQLVFSDPFSFKS